MRKGVIMYIILISGFSTSGKDSLGSVFCNNYGFSRFAFADTLKEFVSEKYKCDLSILNSQSGKGLICTETGTTWRSILIEESKLYRNTCPTFYAEDCADKIEDHCILNTVTATHNIVITDWRYPNELYTLRKRFPCATIIPVKITCKYHHDISPVDDASEYSLVKCTDEIEYEFIKDTELQDCVAFAETVIQSIGIGQSSIPFGIKTNNLNC